MDIGDLRQIHDNYDHIYLSPHLDDAVLSCGGAIARHIAEGAHVLVVTICTASPPPGAPLSSLAEDLHRRWGLAEDVMDVRLREDTLAIERLGADSYWVGMLDAIYRHPDVYNSRETLFGTPTADDTLIGAMVQLIGALRGRAPGATFYAPLGVGYHVDHQIVMTAALQNGGDWTTAFYEDVPYVLTPGALEQRLAGLGQRFVASTINIDATLSRKIGAITAYASQIGELFGDLDQMRQKVIAYAEDLRPEVGTYGERLWLRAPADAD